MTQQGTYVLAPSFPFKLDIGPIRLGSHIADPRGRHGELTTVGEIKLKVSIPTSKE